jgi:aspartyl-tRNA(Asn)/glutamyl-tRNA(Gln) amidotransferase subunit B
MYVYAAMQAMCDVVIKENPDKVEQIKLHPQKLGWLVGKVLILMDGHAEPQYVTDELKKKLNLS